MYGNNSRKWNQRKKKSGGRYWNNPYGQALMPRNWHPNSQGFSPEDSLAAHAMNLRSTIEYNYHSAMSSLNALVGAVGGVVASNKLLVAWACSPAFKRPAYSRRVPEPWNRRPRLPPQETSWVEDVSNSDNSSSYSAHELPACTLQGFERCNRPPQSQSTPQETSQVEDVNNSDDGIVMPSCSASQPPASSRQETEIRNLLPQSQPSPQETARIVDVNNSDDGIVMPSYSASQPPAYPCQVPEMQQESLSVEEDSDEVTLPAPKPKFHPLTLRELFKRDYAVPPEIALLLRPFTRGPFTNPYSNRGKATSASVFEAILNDPLNLEVLQSEPVLKLCALPLHQQLESLVTSALFSVSLDQLRIGWQLCLDLFTILHADYPLVKITPVGTLNTGFFLASVETPPDLRIVVELRPNSKTRSHDEVSAHMARFENLLKNRTCAHTGKKFLNFTENRDPQSTAIEFFHLSSGLRCCVHFTEDEQVRRDQLVQRCLSRDPRIVAFIRVLQYWAKHAAIFGQDVDCEPLEYALFLMALTFLLKRKILHVDGVLNLENKPETGEKIDMGGLSTSMAEKVVQWVEAFFEMFGYADFSKVAVCPLKGKLVTKKELLNANMTTERALENAKQTKEEMGRIMETELEDASMIIQDPVSPCTNVWGFRGQQVLEKMQLRFRMSWGILRAEQLSNGWLDLFIPDFETDPKEEEEDVSVQGNKLVWEETFEVDTPFVECFMRKLEVGRDLEAMEGSVAIIMMDKLWREFAGEFLPAMLQTGMNLKRTRVNGNTYRVTYPFWRNRTEVDAYPEGENPVEWEQKKTEKVMESRSVMGGRAKKRRKLELALQQEKFRNFCVQVEGNLTSKVGDGMPVFQIKVLKLANPKANQPPADFPEAVKVLSQILVRAFPAHQSYQLGVRPSLGE